MNWTVHLGDVRDVLRSLPEQSVQCCVTSPPYWGLRDYGVEGQLGLEATPETYVANMVEVFRDVRRVLKDDGTLWLNLGDSYAGSWKNQGRKEERGTQRPINGPMMQSFSGHPSPVSNAGVVPDGLKAKDLVGIPWMVAFALRADGWYLRSDIVWAKPNPMPESVTDRPTKSHEYIFLLTKKARYYYDAAAICEPMAQSSINRLAQDLDSQTGSTRANGGAKTNGPMKAVGKGSTTPRRDGQSWNENNGRGFTPTQHGANKRSVWTVATQPYSGAHFATFPEALPTTCLLAGSRQGDVVLDTFCGSGTTGAAAIGNGRNFIGIELNPTYRELARKRIGGVAPMFAQEVA